MPKCPECGREFEKRAVNQKYCPYETVSIGSGKTASRCMKRAKDRRWYRNANPATLERKRERTKRWKQEMKDNGLCPRCGKNAPGSGVVCGICMVDLGKYR